MLWFLDYTWGSLRVKKVSTKVLFTKRLGADSGNVYGVKDSQSNARQEI